MFSENKNRIFSLLFALVLLTPCNYGESWDLLRRICFLAWRRTTFFVEVFDFKLCCVVALVFPSIWMLVEDWKLS